MTTHGPHGQHYLNPLNKIKWQAALEKRAAFVFIDNTRYELTYFRRGDDDIAAFRPTGQFTPRGEFNLRQVLNDAWLTGN